jgi:serine protease Do
MASAEETERLPCPVCGELTPAAAQMCLHCGSSQLVDVTLAAPVADGRLRYRVARALHALPGAPPLGDIQKALAGSPPAAARGVTRAFANAALAVLSENGLRAGTERTVQPEPRPGPLSAGTLLGALAAVVLVAGGYVAWRGVRGGGGAPASSPAPVAGEPARPGTGAPGGAAAMSPRDLARLALPATVSLRCRNSVGSGFFVGPDLVVTNAHVLCPPGEAAEVGLSDGRRLAGEVVRSDTGLDLALVRAQGAAARPLALGDVGDLAVGDRVMIVGSPVGLDFTVQEGTISSLQRSALGVAYIQLDAKISPGNSGGPVVDGRGRVVGVVSMKLVGEGVEGIGLAIPINYAYDARTGFVAPPSGAAAGSAAFARMVADAKAAEGTDSSIPFPRDPGLEASAPETPAIDDRPLLVSGYVDPYQRLVVRIVRVTDFPPGYEEIAVSLWSGTEAFCTIKGDVNDWKRIDPGQAGSGLPPQAVAALQRLAPGRTLYVGESPLRWDLCDRSKVRPGIEVELQGASPVANRMVVR